MKSGAGLGSSFSPGLSVPHLFLEIDRTNMSILSRIVNKIYYLTENAEVIFLKEVIN